MNNKNFPDHQHIAYICELFFAIFKVSIVFVDHEKKLVTKQAFRYQQNPLVPDLQKLFQELFPDPLLTYPVFSSTEFFENYFAIDIIQSDMHIGRIIAGPATFTVINQATIDSFFSNFKISPKLKSEVTKYYSHVPCIENKLWADAGRLLYFLLYQEKIELPDLVEVGHFVKEAFSVENKLEPYLLEKRKKRNSTIPSNMNKPYCRL
ncbi:hypothetical protein P22_3178 [Propionispora sp. 2/2-37]|uniref:hypothetical protein n=1 Tax=Propionispora sp. 2/2-37 TaxID=1677858 RepID=UPI0006BB84B2|nr:hypothetical protein [Propionispora sp. 2/2-37]CUH97052.1 hypothetical protein P22_3178 [Propionispora sp. 2/2-37]